MQNSAARTTSGVGLAAPATQASASPAATMRAATCSGSSRSMRSHQGEASAIALTAGDLKLAAS